MQEYWLYDLAGGAAQTPIWTRPCDALGLDAAALQRRRRRLPLRRARLQLAGAAPALEIATGALLDTSFTFYNPPGNLDDDSNPGGRRLGLRTRSDAHRVRLHDGAGQLHARARERHDVVQRGFRYTAVAEVRVLQSLRRRVRGEGPAARRLGRGHGHALLDCEPAGGADRQRGLSERPRRRGARERGRPRRAPRRYRVSDREQRRGRLVHARQRFAGRVVCAAHVAGRRRIPRVHRREHRRRRDDRRVALGFRRRRDVERAKSLAHLRRAGRLHGAAHRDRRRRRDRRRGTRSACVRRLRERRGQDPLLDRRRRAGRRRQPRSLRVRRRDPSHRADHRQRLVPHLRNLLRAVRRQRHGVRRALFTGWQPDRVRPRSLRGERGLGDGRRRQQSPAPDRRERQRRGLRVPPGTGLVARRRVDRVREPGRDAPRRSDRPLHGARGRKRARSRPGHVLPQPALRRQGARLLSRNPIELRRSSGRATRAGLLPDRVHPRFLHAGSRRHDPERARRRQRALAAGPAGGLLHPGARIARRVAPRTPTRPADRRRVRRDPRRRSRESGHATDAGHVLGSVGGLPGLVAGRRAARLPGSRSRNDRVRPLRHRHRGVHGERAARRPGRRGAPARLEAGCRCRSIRSASRAT